MAELRGIAVLLTREPEDNRALADLLRARGAETLELPCVRSEPLAELAPLARTIRALGPEDRLVLTSPRGVDAVLRVVRADEIRAPISAVGPATARRLAEAGLRAEVASQPATGVALGRELPIPRGRILLARADRASGDLPEVLRGRGARVEEVVAYRTIAQARGDVAGVRDRIAGGGVEVLVFASASAVDGFFDAVPAEETATARAVAIGPTTAARLLERASIMAAVAEQPTNEELLRTIERVVEEAHDVSRS